MNSDIVVGKWKQLKGNFLAMWAEWFDSDCAWLEGNNGYLSGVLQEDYGKEYEKASSEKRVIH
ncbi:stress-response protein [Brenneria populi subsp. brevivirga]|uniref:Stress-response protein n=1 Tax=Brenneria populi TaxID=1505588 RepID=A0ABU6JQC9_9GAMM|nr:stress-response protein [Brenneria populi subsp. brevivirga]MEC5342717.1 stress-response protein [Brenneria populi Li et al. 2015]